MARLKSIFELDSDSKQDHSSIQASNDSQVSNTLDPLMLAFTEEEVQRFKKSVSTNTNTPTLETNSLQKGLPNMTAESVAQDQLKLANQAVIDGNPMFALSLCEKALPHLPASSALYDCACDACISLEKFDKAELYALHSIITGQPSFKNYFNLATFASMRNDLSLAQYYFSKASAIDPSNVQLAQLKKNLTDITNKNQLFKFI